VCEVGEVARAMLPFSELLDLLVRVLVFFDHHDNILLFGALNYRADKPVLIGSGVDAKNVILVEEVFVCCNGLYV
jgi:hypothetical protein